MKNRGFTLIELLGVIIILALLVILVFPSIINSVRNSSSKTDQLTLDLIYNASDLYISSNVNNFPKINGNKYTIELKDLVDEGLLASPIKLSDSADDITNNKCIQVIYNDGYNFELKEKGTCEKTKFCTLSDEDNNGKYSVGDKVSCEFTTSTEVFYIMENANEDTTPDQISMLSMFKLDVGYSVNINSWVSTSIEQPTGIQRELYRIDSTIYGIAAFSTSNYWSSSVSSYPAWVYNKSSNLYQYVNAYETYFKRNGVNSASATLISYEQVNDLTTTVGQPSWLYSTTYWTGSAYATHGVYVVYDSGWVDVDNFNIVTQYGVRPVITISIEDLNY